MPDLVSSHFIYKQTDLWLTTDGEPDRKVVEKYLIQAYHEIERYAESDKAFLHSLHPIRVPETVPGLIRVMAQYSTLANVGPMAGIAGAIAEYIGRRLSACHRLILCNNGGDIFYKADEEQSLVLSAPGSPFDHKIKIHVPPALEGKGVCTSSGVAGHSINMGRSFAVTILAESACCADVWATSVSNRIRTYLDLDRVLSWCREEGSIEGGVILVDHYLAAWGNIRLSRAE